MEFLFLAAGSTAGFIISWLYFKYKNSESAAGASAIIAENNLEKIRLEERNHSLQSEVKKISNELLYERETLNAANSRLAKAEEAFKNMQEKLNTQKTEMEELQKKFATEFENIANRLLEEKSKKFTEQNKTNIDIVLNPLKEKIKDFEEKVEKAYDKELRDKISLREEIKKLFDLNQKISLEANNLTNALKGNNKLQGNWGEMMLERILERSGLIKDQEYKTQVSLTNDEGKRIQPDVVILLPDNKHIIIDAKVSLLAYETFVNAAADEDKQTAIKSHIDSIRAHIKGLSEKNYHASATLNSPEFVLLFIPVESSFSIALQTDHELFNFAWDRKIVLVTPSTLLATLKTIASIWKQEKQTANAIEIAKQSGALYDKFVGFLDDMLKIEKNLKGTWQAYESAKKKLEGHGSLIKRAEGIRKLGAKTTKSIPEGFVPEENNDLLVES